MQCPLEIVVPHRQNRQFSSISCDCPSYSLHLILEPHPCTPFLICSKLVSLVTSTCYTPTVGQRVRSRAIKAGNVKRRTESQKVAEIPRRKSLARIFAFLTALRGMSLSPRNSAEFHSENLPSLKLSFSRISQSQVTLNQQEIPLNKSSGGNSAAEIHSKNLSLSNCSPRDVVIIWKFCCGNPQRESP